MTVVEFHDTYLRLCKDHHVEPQDCVLHALDVSQKGPHKGGYCLNLSTHSLSVQTCAILAKVFTTDRTFLEIKLNDCMIPEEGMKAIAHGFIGNVACKKLDLKGNNIRGTATEALGRMLRQNKTLLSMCLEWNALGMLDTAFSVFCEGLGSNPTLQVLDLRNNQINHDGATELAAAIKRNTTVRSLDLRWNNIGLIGGRALLNALDYNKTLVRLDLAGNNTPCDVLKSIETYASRNADRAELTTDFKSKQHMLSREIQVLKKTRHSESKVAELMAIVTQTKEEQAEFIRQSQLELKHEREDRAVAEGKLQKELIKINERNMELENKIDDLERKCKGQQEQIFDLKEQLTAAHAEVKLKAAQFDERLQFEKSKLKDAYRDNDELKLKEIQRIKQEAEETEKLLKERIQKLEMTRIELEEDISRQKNALATERLQAEEQLSTLKQRLKHEEEQRCRQLEEKIRMLISSKEELSSHCSQQVSSITELQARNANLILENETLRHRIETLNQVPE
ncbi:hypothetical protein LSH36_127g12010 [Paralvinella palmiformis]|uniref:Leucine-rich repeat-containing protein 45 n=1 Tax=Paralvinella palmiformis TaxID=53620 RepID=A0AAD9N9V1_9ANNE|nr:hypothetical protein LSH36_127g12010 [Paralvinella palmiformis]